MSKWEKVALKHIGEIVTGNTPSTKIDDYYNSNDIPFYKPNDISNTEVSKLNIATSYISETARSCARIIPCNSILVTCIGIIGKTAITTTECSCNQQINAIIPYKDLANSLYLAYAIMSRKTYMQDTANAPIVPIINKTKFASIEIPLPPLEEQHKIASILDTVSKTLKLRKQQLNELDLLVKSKFIEMFGYIDKNNNNFEYTSLGLCCKINPKKSEDTRLTSNLDISFIAMPSVSEKGSIDTSNIRKYNEVKKGFTYFTENDVLFAKITPCMENGKGCIAHGLKNNIGFGSTEFHVLRPIPQKSNPYWLYYLSTFETFRNNAKQNMTGSAGQRRVPASFLENYPVALPPIELQNKFASFVQHVDELKSEVQKSIDQLQTLFDSLMQQYFE